MILFPPTVYRNRCKQFLQWLILAVLLVAFPSFSKASVQDSLEKRPIVSTYSLEIGGGHATDTYLSPLRYHGVHLALSGDWSKALPFGKDLSMSFRGRIEGMHLNNPAGNATEWQGAVGFDWLIRRGWRLTDRLVISAGGGAGLYAGVVYLPHNSNNPAAAKALVGLEGTVAASYRLQLGKLGITLRDEVLTPVAGIFFSQDYGQPYYSIYLGDRDNLVHASWWGNNFCIDNLLNCRLHFDRGDLGIGYRFRLYSGHICNIDTRIPTHAAVISWTPGRRNCSDARLNYPLY